MRRSSGASSSVQSASKKPKKKPKKKTSKKRSLVWVESVDKKRRTFSVTTKVPQIGGVDIDIFVLAMTLQTASLELSKDEYLEMAPVSGVIGPFRLSGNSLPVIEYRVFDPRKKPFMMEFVKVRVEISKPARVYFSACIDSKGSADPARHGEEVEVLPKYKEPFERLAAALFNYFPFYANPPDRRNPNRKDVPKLLTLDEATEKTLRMAAEIHGTI